MADDWVGEGGFDLSTIMKDLKDPDTGNQLGFADAAAAVTTCCCCCCCTATGGAAAIAAAVPIAAGARTTAAAAAAAAVAAASVPIPAGASGPSGATTTTITINTPKALVAGTTLTFFTINQSYWKEYNLFIGTSPAPFLGSGGGIVDTAMSNAAAGAQAILTWKQPIAIGVLAAGMLVYDDGVLIGSISTIDSTTQVTLVANLTGAVADLSKLTFVYPAAASISVLTLDNRTVTITSPAEGFVLPLSVVQITATSNGLANIIALE